MGTSASFARKALHCLAAALLAFTLVPASAFAQGEVEQLQSAIDSQDGETQEAGSEQADEGSGSAPAASPTEGGTLASTLVGTPTAFINSDVALDGEPVVGSFTVDGLTFAVEEGSDVELVGVSSDRQQVTSSPEGDGSPVAPMLASGPDGPDADSSALALPGSVTYDGVDYAVTSIGAYAFYLSGVTAVELPASVTQVDDRAFRSSDVASIAVAEGNPTYSSFDGALYSADYSSLLLIPEGKQGTVLLPKRAEVADAGKFSHCSLASAIAVEEGSAAFASENGLLYDASLTTLLRVPAGATDIVIRDGCTTIAAGALEACASLETITAPASVTSISPDVFASVPTVRLPAVLAVADDPGASTGATEGPSEQAASTPALDSTTTQLTAMVALSSADDDLPEVNVENLLLLLAKSIGRNAGDTGVEDDDLMSEEATPSLQSFSANNAGTENDKMYFYGAEGLYVASSTSSGLRALSMDDPFLFAHSVNYWRYTGQSVVVNNVNGTHTCGVNSGATGISSLYRNTTPSLDTATKVAPMSSNASYSGSMYLWINPERTLSWDANGGACDTSASTVLWGQTVEAPVPYREYYVFKGWSIEPEGGAKWCDGGTVTPVVKEDMTLYAQWEPISYGLGFDVDSEPRDEGNLGEAKDDQAIVADQVEAGEKVEIVDPKRPGYVFQGWTIPNADGTEAIDQELVYKDEADGKWYVDASKLPDYANDEGRVELTARWTSVISVDVPSAVTFYADVVTEGQESREGAASSAFGQNKVASQSQVDLRIVGLESTAVATQGSTLGADSILKKSASATPSSSTQKLFSLYPTDKVLTPDDLQDPDAVSQAKPADAVDFALDDLLLEKSFAADSFTIPAGDTLNLGYRLNLSETGTELDYDTLSALDEGTSASIANISYCFAADLPAGPFPTGTVEDDLWVSNVNESWAPIGIYGLADIKAAANDLASCAARAGLDASVDEVMKCAAESDYYAFYQNMLDAGTAFKLKVVTGGVAGWYDVQILGICQDRRADGLWAGLTFGFKDLWAYDGKSVAGSSVNSMMNADGLSTGSWAAADLRTYLRDGFYSSLGSGMRNPSTGIVELRKAHQAYGSPYLQTTEDETVFVPSVYEILGCSTPYCTAETAANSFQYQWFAKGGQSTTNAYAVKRFQGTAGWWWTRSAFSSSSNRWNYMFHTGSFHYGYYENQNAGLLPCFAL